MGTEEGLTVEARNLILESQVLIGAKRMLMPFRNMKLKEGTVFFQSYKPQEIKEYIEKQESEQISILLSGDVGFYSGAKKLLEVLSDYDVRLVPGISSLVYFCSKLRTTWEDVCLGSLHGRTCNWVQLIKRNKKTFLLLSGGKDVKMLCKKLIYYGMGKVVLHIGERLSYADERIVSEQAERIQHFDYDNLLVVLAENKEAKDKVALSIPDEQFIRDKVPMTKQEVRNITIGKLGLCSDAIVYDVGAGSGSVSIEIALQSPDIQVYAIEKEKVACELIEKNKQKFAADNVEVVCGMAPGNLSSLPVPTHVFIGGSAGNMEAILSVVYEKNPNVTVVLNTVSLNSLSQVLELAKKHEEWELDIVQIQTSKAKTLGAYQLMMGQNPVYVITIKQKIAFQPLN